MKLTFPTVFFLLLLTLKLLGKISWSWWLVTAPLWGTIAGCFLIVVLAAVFAAGAKR